MEQTLRRDVHRTDNDRGNAATPVAARAVTATLDRQVLGWADVARAARERNERGEAAEAELARRRNRSGQ